MLRSCAAALLVAALIGAPAFARERQQPRRYADPGAVVAAEIAFARLAQEKGQWTAFAKTAAKDAVMFVPDSTDARKWLKGRRNPPEAVRWQTHDIWMSCDGALAISTGAAQWPGGKHGEFLTIWKRQDQGGYRWVADMGRSLKAPLAAPEMVRSHVGTCATPVPADRRRPTSEVASAITGNAPDGSLQYVILQPGGGPVIHIRAWDGTAFADHVVKAFVDE